ncbi:MAG: DUF6526 family protein [Bacteroidota bacterium]
MTQNFSNHRQFVPGYHYVTLTLILISLVGSVVNLSNSFSDHSNLYSASLIVLMNIIMGLLAFYARSFALRAQNRAIRAEENLRHFVLTGKPLDPALRIGQIVALRFATDTEFVALAAKAVKEEMSATNIKKSITKWKGDYHRV